MKQTVEKSERFPCWCLLFFWCFFFAFGKHPSGNNSDAMSPKEIHDYGLQSFVLASTNDRSLPASARTLMNTLVAEKDLLFVTE